MFVMCNYAVYSNVDTEIIPKWSNFLRILEMFVFPLFLICLSYGAAGLFQYGVRFFVKLSSSPQIFRLLLHFVIFSSVLHFIIYLLFCLNYYNRYLLIIFVNYVSFAAVVICYVCDLAKRLEAIYIIFVLNISTIIVLCKDDLMFTINDQCQLILNRNESMFVLIKCHLYEVRIAIDKKRVVDISYNIYYFRLLSNEDLKFLRIIDNMKNMLNNPVVISFLKPSNYRIKT